MTVEGTRLDGRERPGAMPGPVLAVCGWSGAGKTTLLEAVIPTLVARGLRVAVLKTDVHGLHVDHPGKDSDRLFQAGADVALRGPGEALRRSHRDDSADLAPAVAALLADHDLVLIEGHRSAPLPKVWLASADDPEPPRDLSDLLAVLPRDGERPSRLLELLDAWLPPLFATVPLACGVLIGGASRRMGTPKQLLRHGDATLLERTVATLAGRLGEVVLLGDGPVPEGCRHLRHLSDSSGSSGPLAGMLAAHRWAPEHAWLFCPCDLPDLDSRAIDWLLGQRRPGRWAVLPRTEGGLEPLLALYEPQARALVERLAGTGERAPRLLAEHPKVAAVPVPAGLAHCWRCVNTPDDLRSLNERS